MILSWDSEALNGKSMGVEKYCAGIWGVVGVEDLERLG
jgi:hypothetical protein